MDKSELYSRIAGGEDSFTEFKRDVTQRSDFASEMIAFANMEGGSILIGVSDEGAIVGVADPQRVEKDPFLSKSNAGTARSRPVCHPPDREGWQDLQEFCNKR